MPQPLLYCHCTHYGIVPAPTRRAVLRAMCEAGAEFDAVSDLCRHAARREPGVRQAAQAGAAIAACYPRAVRWLLAAGGAEADAQVTVLNQRTDPAEAVLAAITLANTAALSVGFGELPVVLYEGDGAATMTPGERFERVEALLEAGYGVKRSTDPAVAAGAGGDGPVAVVGWFGGHTPPSLSGSGAHVLDVKGKCPCGTVAAVEAVREQLGLPEAKDWVPWFPVIDYDRCTNCRQCRNFCLFGTFGDDGDGRVLVAQPDHCKTNCPACARLCPAAAIIFPKYGAAPIHGGEANAASVETARVNVSELVSGDVYAKLRARARDTGGSDAEALRRELDIPPEVLQGVRPSELVRRASAAKEGCCGPAGDPGNPDCACESEFEDDPKV